MTNARKAERLTTDALTTFRTAHAKLVEANALHDDEAARHQQAQSDHRQAELEHVAKAKANDRVIDKLADFVA